MILIAYDGSDHAKAAIEAAARLMPGAHAVVVMVWERYVDGLARVGAVGLGGIPQGAGADFDLQFKTHALKVATDGAELASAAGLTASAQAEPSIGSIGHTLLDLADSLDADAIVLGTRGLGRMKSLVLGSTSHHVVQHADRPVIVVPATKPTD